MARKPEKTDEPQTAGQNFAKAHLKAFVDRLERLDEEKAAITSDIKDVYTEAASQGFDKKALRPSSGYASKMRPSGQNTKQWSTYTGLRSACWMELH